MQWDATTRLYPIVDSDVCAARGLSPAAVAEAFVAAGARLLQLRVKGAAARDFLVLAQSVVAAARRHGASVIVNDRADIGRMAGADGIHVGQEDLAPALVRTVFPDAVIGLSTHDEPQIDAALQSDADYIAVGPIFATGTKDTGYSARGLGLVAYAAGRGKPVVAIGGITLATAPQVLDAGASAVAVISDLLAGDPGERVRLFLGALG